VSWHVRLSRRVNGMLGGRADTMLCARFYAEHHPACRYFDAFFLIARGERDHCRNVAAWEAEQRAVPQRSRRAGL
jgi:hypothetical protein